MPENVTLTDEAIFRYIESQPTQHQSQLMIGAKQIIQQCTPSFRQQLNAPLVVALPVAAEDEAAYIEHTLTQYASQIDPPPYRLLAYVNFEKKAANAPERMAAVNKTASIINRFIQSHPEVPMGMVAQELEQPNIGAIRKFIADLALIFSVNSPRDDTLLLIHDADLIKLNPHYLRRMGDAFDRGMPAGHVLSSQVRHAYSHELPCQLQLPHMDTVNAWYDLGVKLTKNHYELGVGIRGSDYVRAGGYEPDIIGGSTLHLMRKIQETHQIDEHNWQEVVGTTLLTSPRRFYYKLLAQKTAPEFWEKGDMQTHDYRTFDPAQIEDISAADRDRHIALIISRDTDMLYHMLRSQLRAKGIEPTSEEICRKIDNIIRIGHAMLGSREWPSSFYTITLR